VNDRQSPLSAHRADAGVDAPFDVGFVHRLRRTRSVFDPANATLRDAIASDHAAGPRKVVVLVDAGVAGAWPDLAQQIARYATTHEDVIRLVAPAITVPGGEACKNTLDVFHTAVEATQKHGICRRSYVIAVGGGAMLDAVGFAAATAHRGVRLIRIPTTTLAQDDAAIGVKNGVNLFGKKNFLGTFAVPWAVINDSAFLSTLSDRDYRSGFSEAVKVALVRDLPFFELIERNADRIAARDMVAAEPVIARSAELHLKHITMGGDPFELREARPLDFGHWSAHKLESMSNFQIRHGEAVAIGVLLDCVYSNLLGWLSTDDLSRIRSCMTRLGFELWHRTMDDHDTLLNGLEEFREHLGGRLTVTLLRAPGRPQDVHEIDRALMHKALDQLRRIPK
jgi:3-dehydroquinate synthase